MNFELGPPEMLDLGEGYKFPQIRPRVHCEDGFSMSVQASENHYCLPNDNEGPYLEAEVGYPSEAEPLLMEYSEDPENPAKTVYGHVPLEVINEIIDRHGGLASERVD